MSDPVSILNGEYDVFLKDLKGRIETAQIRAAVAVNRELVMLYWQIGRAISAKQAQRAWGEKVLDRLAADLQQAFPGVEGFSVRNLFRMRAFYQAYSDESQFVTQPVSQIPWGHNIIIFQKMKETQTRLWYAQNALEYGWSRAVLTHQIETKLYERQARPLPISRVPCLRHSPTLPISCSKTPTISIF